MNNFCILLDNGHGSNTPGKRSPNGVFREYEFSRDMTKRIKNALGELGYVNVNIIVPEEWDVSLSTRCKRVNEYCDKYGAKNCVLLSVHANAAGMGNSWHSANYWTVWTSKGQTQGDKFADCLYESAKELLKDRPVKGEFSDSDADYEANFYILKHTKCAAALTENFFQDNLENVKFLMSEEGRKLLTDLHVKAIVKYIESLELA